MSILEVRHFHLFCGLGGGARGFNRGEARVGTMAARFRCIGGIDSDPGAIADFGKLAGVPGTCLDLFSREQYVAFHGHEPPADWREATTADIHAAAGHERPHILFTSPPCKGFSGLLSNERSLSAKYQALNHLTLRGLWLTLEAWKDDPPEFVLLENVPRIQNRGRSLLDRIEPLLRSYGYAVAETTHDCGELGNLAQSRKRFLLVARHTEKVRPFLYEPTKRPLRAVGDVLERLPLPGMGAAGPLHRMPALQWKTWVRLAFVEAGSDWRSLERLRVVDGVLADYLIMPEPFRQTYGVTAWDEPAATITGGPRPSKGKFAVADPRIDGHPKSVQHGVRRWDETAGVVTGKMFVGGGPHAVADPRMHAVKHNNCFRVVRFDEASPTVTAGMGPSSGGTAVADPRTGYGPSAHHHALRVTPWEEHGGTITASRSPGSGALCVADPRAAGEFNGKGKYKVTPFDAPTNTVIGGSTTGNGAFAVADPRSGVDPRTRDHYRTAGNYGVVEWNGRSYAVAGSARHDNGYWSVADPRAPLPEAAARLVAVIRALDGTWHRPFTTLELAALQGLVDPEEHLELYGLSDSAWRERIGNAVPSPAAQAIAGVMGRALLLAWSGETFSLDSEPIWVRPVALALATGGMA